MKTIILSVIPRIFEDRLSQAGMIDTLKMFSEASRDEILHFLEDTAPPSPKGGLMEPFDWSHTGYRHHLRLEHMDRKKKGRWDIPAVDVLIQWLQAIQPVLSTNDISFAVASSLFTREQSEQDIMGHIRPEMASALERYIFPIEGDKRLTRFDIWARSSCENLDELLDDARYGTPAQDYKQGMKKARIWVEVITTAPADVVPVLVLVGNLETDPNSILILELNDRLEKSGMDLISCPSFHIESTTVATSEGKDTLWTKCVMATRGSMHTLQEKFASIPTPGSRTRYLVTRDYHFVPLSYPPTDKSDRILKTAIQRQREFLSSATKTAISGFKDIDPFYTTPSFIYTKTCETMENTKTIAEIILLETHCDREGITTDSPVIRVTTNKSKNKLYLTALRTNAESLIQYTNDLLHKIAPWFKQRGQQIQSEVIEARRYVATTTDQTSCDGDMDAGTLIDSSGDTGASRVVAQEGMLVQADIQNLQHLVVSQQAQITELHSLVRLVLNKIVETKPLQPADMVGTISTMVETNVQSSLSSSSAMTISRCTTQMEEQKQLILEHLSESSRQMSTLCATITESDNRHERIFTEAKQIALETKLGHDNLVELLHSTTGCARPRMEALADKPPTEHTEIKHDTLQGAEAKSLWPPSRVPPTWPPNSDHAAIRTRAMGVLNLMDSLPHTPPTWTAQTKAALERPQDTAAITLNTRESICAKCKKQDLGLLFCDRCPGEVMTLYHPTCLTRIGGTADRVCDYCWETAQESMATSTTTQENNLEGTTKTTTTKGDEDTTQPTPQEVHVNTEQHESTDSSGGSTTESEYNPKFRPSPRGRKPQARKEPTSQIQTKNPEPKKISPLQTRAARRAIKKAREDAFDTSDEGEKE